MSVYLFYCRQHVMDKSVAFIKRTFPFFPINQHIPKVRIPRVRQKHSPILKDKAWIHATSVLLHMLLRYKGILRVNGFDHQRFEFRSKKFQKVGENGIFSTEVLILTYDQIWSKSLHPLTFLIKTLRHNKILFTKTKKLRLFQIRSSRWPTR